MFFYNVTFWFFDLNGIFYKRIDSEEMTINNKQLILKNNTINQDIEKLNNNQINNNFSNLQHEINKNLNQKIEFIK